MSEWDWEKLIATVLWVASVAAVAQWPHIAWIAVIATTLNLLHQRYTQYFAGTTLQTRVRKFIGNDLDQQHAKLEVMQKDVADIKESQVKIAGAWRGRNLP